MPPPVLPAREDINNALLVVPTLQLIKDSRFKTSFYRDYLFYWFFVGALLALNLVIFFHLGVQSKQELSSKQELFFTSVLIVYLDIALLIPMYITISKLQKDAIESITNYYQCRFPYIKIKTGSGGVTGQLEDIKNKSLIALNEKNVLKIVPWDKIEILEASNINTNESIILDDSSIKS